LAQATAREWTSACEEKETGHLLQQKVRIDRFYAIRCRTKATRFEHLHDIRPPPYNLTVPAPDNLTTVRRYLQAIASNVPVEELLSFFSPDVVQEGMPNRLKPQGGRCGLAEIRQNYERGQQIMASQQYDVQSAVAEGDTVAIEVLWTGRLAVAVAHLQPGAEMCAHCAIFFQFQDGKIVRQRNYDCFEPF
jgi:ketosteroid isomerase-like protein